MNYGQEKVVALIWFLLNYFSEDIYMTPKNNSPSDLKPEDIYVFDNEDVNDISEAPEHLEISPSAEIFMEILKLKTPGVILHSVDNKALVLTHLVRGNEYRIKNHPMVKVNYWIIFDCKLHLNGPNSIKKIFLNVLTICF